MTHSFPTRRSSDLISNYSANSDHPTPAGSQPTHTKRRTKDFIEPAHFLIDAITFANNEEFVSAARRYSSSASPHRRTESTQYSVSVDRKSTRLNSSH